MSPAHAPAHSRERLLDAAERLIEELGPGRAEALTVRMVCEAAGVRAPTLYHFFGDKDGLLSAQLARAVATFGAMRDAATDTSTADPFGDFRRGWDSFVEFALEHRGMMALALVRPEVIAVASAAADALTVGRLVTAAEGGRLTVPLDRAADLSRAGIRGVLALVLEPEGVREGERTGGAPPTVRERALAVSAVLREAVLAAIGECRGSG